MDSSLWVSSLIIVVLIGCSAFLSASETALTAASKFRLHQLMKKGVKKVVLVQALQQRMENLIGTLLLGNTLVNALAASLTTSVLMNVLGESGVYYATILISFMIVLFAEVMPKTYTINHPETSAAFVAPFIHPLVWIFTPVTSLIRLIARAIWRLLSVKIDPDTGLHTSEEELRGAIELHVNHLKTRYQGKDRREKEMLSSILDLGSIEVSEIMTHRKSMGMLNAEDPIEKIVEQVLESPYTRIPLWKEDPDNIIGVLHAKDLFRAVEAQGSHLRELDITKIASKPWFIPETTTLVDQLHAFRQRREHFALVVDEYGALLGIISLEDILEEIVGEIVDEHDVSGSGIKEQADGSYLVEGHVTLRDLNRQFDWELPDEEASTVGGLIIYETRQIPEVGQSFDLYGFKFEVMRRRRNQLTLVKVTSPKKLENRQNEAS